MLGDKHSKEVRREDLGYPISSPWSSPAPEQVDHFRSRLDGQFTFVDISADADIKDAVEEELGNDEVSFRLFASATGAREANLVRLRSPSVEARAPGFVRPDRPASYYFADPSNEIAFSTLTRAAVEGADVIARSKHGCPGCRLPWRVSLISPSQDRTSESIPVKDAPPVTTTSSRKMKPGKKHRIALRIKRAAADAAKQAQQQSAMDKETAEREKRTRRNREKKFKKKEKEKAKKITLDPA